jgi:membrane-associated protease RseP (regulator of RpoE activity)
MNKEAENERELIGRDEEAVSRLVGDLKHVEAPANFERRVMSQIAEGEPRSYSRFSLPALALAAGAVIVLLVGSIVFYRMRQPAPENTVVQTPIAAPAPVQQNTASVGQNIAPQPSADPEMVAQNGIQPLQQVQTQDRQTPKQIRPETNSNVGGGSITTGLNEARPIYPQGLKPNVFRSNVNTSELVSPNAISVQDILGMPGITVEYSSGWLVKAVSKNSPAERSGVRVGDVITELNGDPLTAETKFHGSGTVTTLTVRRDGQSLVLKLK